MDGGSSSSSTNDEEIAGDDCPEVFLHLDEGDDDGDWEPRGSGNRRRPGHSSSAGASRSTSGSSSIGDSGGGDGGGTGGRGSSYADDYNDRACAALLKYRRVAGFITGGQQQQQHQERRREESSAPSPEDIAPWLDERLIDKNIAPLYRMGLRPEHVDCVVETLLRGERGVGDGGGGDAFGGLGEARVRRIVADEATRRDGSRESGPREKEGGGGGGAGDDEGAGEGSPWSYEGGKQTRNGPWQK